MIFSSTYKFNQFLWLGVKLFIVILSCFFLYHQVFDEQNDSSFFDSIMINLDFFSFKNIFFLLIFSFFNWFFEILKWKVLTKSVRENSWLQATRESLASLSFSLLTPNRIGEYGAKVFFYPKEHFKKILLFTFIQHFYQWVTTLLFGLVGIPFTYHLLQELYKTSDILYLILIFIFLFAVFPSTPKVVSYLKKVSKSIKSLGINIQMNTIVLSVVRYLIFSHQFYFLLLLSGTEVSYKEAMICIFSTYLIASVIPIISVLDFAVKGSVAVFIFGFFDVSPSIIILVTTTMWLFNFAVPALVGNYFILTVKK